MHVFYKKFNSPLIAWVLLILTLFFPVEGFRTARFSRSFAGLYLTSPERQYLTRKLAYNKIRFYLYKENVFPAGERIPT